MRVQLIYLGMLKMTAKDKYYESLIILKVLEDNLGQYKKKVRKYMKAYQEECPHIKTREVYDFVSHTREEYTYSYCTECDKYLGSK